MRIIKKTNSSKQVRHPLTHSNFCKLAETLYDDYDDKEYAQNFRGNLEVEVGDFLIFVEEDNSGELTGREIETIISRVEEKTYDYLRYPYPPGAIGPLEREIYCEYRLNMYEWVLREIIEENILKGKEEIKINVSDIPQMSEHPKTKIEVEWCNLEEKIKIFVECNGLKLNSDYFRGWGSEWGEYQQRQYIEYCIRGGVYCRDILLNFPGLIKSGDNFGDGIRGDFVVVDGLQRLIAVRKFISNDLSVFDGCYLSNFDEPEKILKRCKLFFYVNNLKTLAKVMQWHLDLNTPTGGIHYSKDGINRIKKLIRESN